MSDLNFAVSHVMLPLTASSRHFKTVGCKVELKQKMTISISLQNLPVMNVKKDGSKDSRNIYQSETSRFYSFQWNPLHRAVSKLYHCYLNGRPL